MSSSDVPPPYRLPSIARRIVGSILLLVPFLLILVAAPAYLLQRLAEFGVSSPVSLPLVAGGGTTLAILGAARYGLKPSRLYGPISVAASVAAIVYLLAVAPRANLAVPLGNGLSAGVGFGLLVEWLILPVGLSLVAGLVTTIEDLARPKERLPFDYPA
ncbi:MAG TPA: hypothetical protein VJS68_00215 [Thermoplasmata archaeon]|nr:hypothetical protein [Thermoplasmata archaeon]